MAGVHALLPPSGADKWVMCAMWPSMNAMFPDDDTEAAREGTAGHWVVSESLTTPWGAVHGQVAPNGYIVTDDIIRAAMVMVDLVRNDPWIPQWLLNVERPVSMAKSVHVHNWGTPDCYVWISREVLRVYDYKAGHGYVDAVGNWQCIDYVRGILDEANLTRQEEDDLIIEIIIVQPNNYDVEGPVRKWLTTGRELRPYFDRLATAAYAATSGDPHATTGAHCLHCPGRAHCPALTNATHRVVSVTTEGTAFSMLPEQVGRELAVLEEAATILKARISGLEAEAREHLERGVRGIGYTLERKPGNLTWSVDPSAVYRLGAAFGIETRKAAPITPTQAIDAGVPEHLVRAYADRPLTSAKLVKFENSLAHRAFIKGNT